MPLWLLGFMFGLGDSRHGFLSQVGVRVTSFWLSMRYSATTATSWCAISESGMRLAAKGWYASTGF
jgi:hypothetical protein